MKCVNTKNRKIGRKKTDIYLFKKVGDKMGKRGMTPQQASEVWESKTKLQKLRVNKGLSQSELSEKTGIAKPTIVCYEQQKIPIDNARLKVLCELCITLGCKLEDILEDKKLIEKYKKVK